VTSRRWQPPTRLADVLPGALQRLGLDRRYREHELWAIWPTVVGAQIARHACPRSLHRGRLVVHVTDPVWLHQLSMLRHRLVGALNAKLSEATVREMVLRIGEVPAPTFEKPQPAMLAEERSADPVDTARVETLLEPLADAPFREALRKLLLRSSPSARGKAIR
jgi:predicted nucleic acid-binding Zn ribbon protein